MTRVPAFYSTNEIKKPLPNRVYHNNSSCPPGRDIPASERLVGTRMYRLCDGCAELNKQAVAEDQRKGLVELLGKPVTPPH